MILAITAVTGDNFVIFVRPLKVPLGNGVVLHRAWFSVIVSVLWVSMSVLSIALTSCIANRVLSVIAWWVGWLRPLWNPTPRVLRTFSNGRACPWLNVNSTGVLPELDHLGYSNAVVILRDDWPTVLSSYEPQTSFEAMISVTWLFDLSHLMRKVVYLGDNASLHVVRPMAWAVRESYCGYMYT